MKFRHDTLRPGLVIFFIFFAALGAFAQPSWTGGYPQLLSGATSVDINIQTDSTGLIYYAIYDIAQGGMTSVQLKNDALVGGNPNLVRSGSAAITADTLLTIKQEALTQNTTFHIYVVAESNGVLMADDQISYTSRFFPKRQQEFYNFANSSVSSYLMYFPEDYYKTTANLPLLIFLGGSGEMTHGGAANPDQLLLTGLPEVINLGKEIPMVVASPQGYYTWQGSATALDAYIAFLEVTYRVDPSKIFLTGLSDGGWGVFQYTNQYPSKVKAIVPISTWPDSDIHNFTNVPVWGFMGTQDTFSIMMNWIDSLKSIGGNATFTGYPGGHEKAVWNAVYDGSRGDDIFKWMLSYTGQNQPPTNIPPVVNAGADQSIDLPLSQLQLTGTATDLDGTIASYTWTEVSGPSVTMTNVNSPTLTLTGISSGTYVFQLDVLDSAGAAASDQVTITANAVGSVVREFDVNITWVWNKQGGTIWNDFVTTGGGVAGNSIVLFDKNHVSSPVLLSIIASFQDGVNNHGVKPGIYPNNVMQYFLRSTQTSVGVLKLSGLSAYSVYDLSILSSNVDVWYPSDTRLTVAGQSATINAKGNANQLVNFQSVAPNTNGEITITVAPATTNSANVGVINALVIKERPVINVAPVVDAGPDQQIVLPFSQLQLTGTASDPDGTIASRLWTEISGPTVTMSDTSTSTLVLTNIVAGTYVFQLNAKDNRGETTGDQITVTVDPGNIVPPVVDAGADIEVALPLTQLLLVGTATDSDGFICSWSWTKVSGPDVTMSSTTSTLTLTNLEVGTYVFELSAQDNAGGTAVDQISVVVNPNGPPAVNAGPDQQVSLPLSQLLLAGTATDADGTIASWVWTEISGPRVSMSDTTTSTLGLTNIAAGAYVFQLSAMDNGGATAADTITVTVDPGNIVPPVVDAGADMEVTLSPFQLKLFGMATDSDGFIYSWSWTKISGPDVTMIDTTTSTLTLTDLEVGTYVFELSAQDNAGGTAADQISVVVNPNVPPAVNAGPDQQITLPLSQLLLAGTATDSDGMIDSLLWTKISGPTVTMANVTTSTLELTNLLAGTYVFQLSARDNSGASTTDQATVIVSPAPILPRDFYINVTWAWNKQKSLPWNDFVTTYGGIVGDSTILFDKDGITSSITISITAPFQNGVNNHGVVPGLYPTNVMRYYLRSTQTKVGSLKLAGLDIDKQYDLSILSSNVDVWYPSDTRLTVQGQSATVNARLNANHLVTFTNISPTAIGEIPITVAPATTNSSNVGVINAIILKEHAAGSPGARTTTTTRDEATADSEKPSAPVEDFVTAFPNPVEDQLNVDITSSQQTPEAFSIEFIDIRGVQVYSHEVEIQDGTNHVVESISADFMQSGLYIMTVRSRLGSVQHFKILKK